MWTSLSGLHLPLGLVARLDALDALDTVNVAHRRGVVAILGQESAEPLILAGDRVLSSLSVTTL